MKRKTADEMRVKTWEETGVEAPSVLGYIYPNGVPDPGFSERKRDLGILSEIEDAQFA